MRPTLYLILLLLLAGPALGQRIRIIDAASDAPVPFAAIRLGNTGQGLIADLDGAAELRKTSPDGFVEISALGYEPARFALPVDSVLRLKAKRESLREVVVRPDEEKIRRIIRTAVDRRGRHNPEGYDWYRCHVYYKMVADAYPRDEGFSKDTAEDAIDITRFLEQQHLILSETYSIRTWKRPQKLQEEVIGSRFSGFKKSMITGLVTDILPFHAYTDYLALNGRDFRNPVSRGSGQWYGFNLRDELLQGADTLWIISFFPKKTGEGLRGSVYIHSGDYAISHFIGSHTDTTLGNTVRIEQQYRQVAGRWFPEQLNYVFHLMQKARKDGFGITMQGSSRIDSVYFDEDPRFRFDKAHTVKLRPAADGLGDSAWARLRPQPLDLKEARTYVFMDSLMESVGAERLLAYMPKLLEAKLPIGPVDLNLERLYTYNSYEGSRYGLGLQTGDRISRRFSVGGWAGYGMHDKAWKYGGFAELYLDPYRESVVRLAYEHNLRDPGRVSIHTDLDRHYLRNYLIARADICDAWSLSLRRRFGYLSAELRLRREEVRPAYSYEWRHEGRDALSYTATEGSIGLRYAFAERSAPVFGRYLATGSRYPVLYLTATRGSLDIAARQVSYTQLLGAGSWQKHIAGIGTERWLVQGGKSFSDAPLPLGKLFAGAGVRNDRYHFFIFGGLQTVTPYTYFSDAFLSWSWRHDFDWKLYRARLGPDFSSVPGLSFVYNGLWGTMANRETHGGLPFSVPSNGFHEAGVMLRDLLRVRYMNLYYLGLNAGFFYPLDGSRSIDAGSYALGASISL